MSYTLKFSKFLHTLNRYIQFLHKDIDPSVMRSYDIALQNMRNLPESKQKSECIRLISELTPLFAECQAAIAASLNEDSSDLEIPFTLTPPNPSIPSAQSHLSAPSESDPTLAPAIAGAQTGTETEQEEKKKEHNETEHIKEKKSEEENNQNKEKNGESESARSSVLTNSVALASLKERLATVEVDKDELYGGAINPVIGKPLKTKKTKSASKSNASPNSQTSGRQSSDADSSVDDSLDDIEFDEDGDCVDFGYVIDEDEPGEIFIPTNPMTGQTEGFGDTIDQNAIPESLKKIDEVIASMDRYHNHIRYVPTFNERNHGQYITLNPKRFVLGKPATEIDACIKEKPIDIYCYLDNITEDAMKVLMDMLLSLDRKKLAYNEFPLLMQWFRSRKRLYSIHNLSEKDDRYKSGGISLDYAYTYESKEDDMDSKTGKCKKNKSKNSEKSESDGLDMYEFKHHVGMKRVKTDVNKRTYELYRRKEISAVMEMMYGHNDEWAGYETLNEKDIVNWHREFCSKDTYTVDGRKLTSVLTKEQIFRHRQQVAYLDEANHTYSHKIDKPLFENTYSNRVLPRAKYTAIVYNERLESMNDLFIPPEIRKPYTFLTGCSDRIPYKDKLRLIGDLALLSMDDKLTDKDRGRLSDGEIIKLYHLTESDTATLVNALDSLPKKNIIALYYRLLCMMIDGRFAEIRMKRYDEINKQMIAFDNLALRTILDMCGQNELDSFASKYRIAMAMFVNEYAKSSLGIDGDILEIQVPSDELGEESIHRLSIAFSVISGMGPVKHARNAEVFPILNGKDSYEIIHDDFFDPRDAFCDYSKIDGEAMAVLDGKPWPNEAPPDGDILSKDDSPSVMDIEKQLDIGKHYDSDTLEVLKAFSDDFRQFYIGLDRSGVLNSVGHRNQAALRTLADRIMAFSSKVDMYHTATSSDADRKYAEGEKIYAENPKEVKMFSTGVGKIRLTEEDVLDGRIKHSRVVDDPAWDPVTKTYDPEMRISVFKAKKAKGRAEREKAKADRLAKKKSPSGESSDEANANDVPVESKPKKTKAGKTSSAKNKTTASAKRTRKTAA